MIIKNRILVITLNEDIENISNAIIKELHAKALFANSLNESNIILKKSKINAIIIDKDIPQDKRLKHFVIQNYKLPIFFLDSSYNILSNGFIESANSKYDYLLLTSKIQTYFNLIKYNQNNSNDLDEERIALKTFDNYELITFVADEFGVLYGNKKFFNFFNCKDLSEFLSKYESISQNFIENKSANYLVGEDWLDRVINSKATHFIQMEKDGEKKVFQIFLTPFEKDVVQKTNSYTIYLTDVTQLDHLKNNLQEEVDIQTEEIAQINEHLIDEVNQAVEENNKIQEHLFESEKMASLGAMIGNIAHQWRQPLSIISTAASGILFVKEYDMLTDELLKDHCDTIVKNAQYLSKTIDVFRDFIKKDKSYTNVIIQDEINEAIEMTKSSLHNNSIQLIHNTDDTEPFELTLVKDELTQVIMNIINNAKDILIEKKIEEPTVILNLSEDLDTIKITIEDNGGGIPPKVLSKIFEPYFTTKHKSQGTGLGLYMSYKIITESLKGKLKAKNTKDGAMFEIVLNKQ